MKPRKPDNGSVKLAYERRRAIILQLESSGAVRVTEIAPRLGVTQETVRRDLDKLAQEGLLRRTHGGAIHARDAIIERPFAERRTTHHAAKACMAQLALEHVAQDDVIALDASSTAHEIARLLPDTRVTVVTNALPATIVLRNRPKVRVMSIGGRLDPSSMSWVGSFAEDALRRINIGKLFLSSTGVDLDRGLSEIDDAQASIKRRMMEAAEQIYLLVDHSKFDVKSAVSFAQLPEVDAVITDADVSEDVVDRLEEIGVSTLIARPANAGVVTA